MVTQISAGVKISVEAFYQPEYSHPLNNDYMFAYHVEIGNNNPFPIKLLHRYWHIVDSNGTRREVEGKGVVCIQPIILPEESYCYISGANLNSGIGKMYGTYLMEDQHNKYTFEVVIPEFAMIVPLKMN